MRASVLAALLGMVAIADCGRARHGDDDPTSPTTSVASESGLYASGSGCPPLPPISGFIGRGDAALLTEGLSPFRGTGSNLYYLQQLLTYAQQDDDPKLAGAVGEVLDDLVCLSLPVARIGGFNDSQDRSSIRKGPHDFQEAGLRGLDQAIWEAKRRGIRLILPLVNNWGDYGGLPAYAAWASQEDGVVHAHDDFFSDPRMRQWWKDYVVMLAERVNTFTGVAYRNEPTILAWEIANEFRCATCRGTTRLVDTVRELGRLPAPGDALSPGRRRRRRI